MSVVHHLWIYSHLKGLYFERICEDEQKWYEMWYPRKKFRHKIQLPSEVNCFCSILLPHFRICFYSIRLFTFLTRLHYSTVRSRAKQKYCCQKLNTNVCVWKRYKTLEKKEKRIFVAPFWLCIATAVFFTCTLYVCWY